MLQLVQGRPRDVWLQELQGAERWYEVAIAQTQRLLDNYDSTPSSDADSALLKALEFQREMMDEYTEVLTHVCLTASPLTKVRRQNKASQGSIPRLGRL